MNIIPSQPIPLFYWRDDLDSFVAAVSAKLILSKNPTELIPVTHGDTIEGLRQRFPIFFGIQFDRLGTMPMLASAANCQFINRSNQMGPLLSQYKAAQNHDPFKVRVPSKWRMNFNNTQSLTRMGIMSFITEARLKEIIPDFVLYVMDAVENPTKLPTNDDFLRGVAKDHSFLTGNYEDFRKRFIVPFKTRGRDIITSMVELGKRPVDPDHLAQNLIQRSAIESEFLGHKVKVLNAPAEVADTAGRLMAVSKPFSVVYEDLMKDNRRVYRLYSTQDGVDVLKLTTDYQPEGDMRYVTFSLKINFTDHKFI